MKVSLAHHVTLIVVMLVGCQKPVPAPDPQPKPQTKDELTYPAKLIGHWDLDWDSDLAKIPVEERKDWPDRQGKLEFRADGRYLYTYKCEAIDIEQVGKWKTTNIDGNRYALELSDDLTPTPADVQGVVIFLNDDSHLTTKGLIGSSAYIRAD